MTFPFTQRLQDLSDHIRQDEILLKSFEDALRFEDDPRRRLRYERDIQQIKASVERHRQEYQALEVQIQAESRVSESSLSTQVATDMKTVASQIDQMDAKLNLVLSGQVEVYQQQQALLEYYDANTQTLISTLAKQLDHTQLALSKTLLSALDADAVSEPEMEQLVAVLEDRLPALMPAETKEVASIIHDPGLEAKHKLKVCVPIIPFLLDYEGELELGSGFNIKNAWERVKTKLGRS
ncbi:MAG: hypothetical protein AAGH78_08235 [Cyanobacteria bacterium P01_H01_bin.58]